MPEIIRYAWGKSSLGDFIAAVSEKGLVAFEFAVSHEGGRRALTDRMPGATLQDDAAGLADVIRELAGVIGRPAATPDLVLDPRGSDYQQRVWSLLQEIPAGHTTSYGVLAARLGTRDARDVTEAISSNGIAILIPCHRVVKKDGSLSGYRWGARRKRALLERERAGTPFRLA